MSVSTTRINHDHSHTPLSHRQSLPRSLEYTRRYLLRKAFHLSMLIMWCWVEVYVLCDIGNKILMFLSILWL